MQKRNLWIFEIIIWLLVIALSFFFFVYRTEIKTNEKNTYYAFFDDVEGLVKGSPVRLMGINIGYVQIVKIFDNKVFISFTVTKEGAEIPKCAVATIEFYGLGGSTSLELNPSAYCDDSKAGIIPSKSYRIQDYWDGSALDSQVLIDIYGSFGRNVRNEDIIKYKPYIFRSQLLKDISNKTKEADKAQTVIINKFTEDTKNYIKNNQAPETDMEENPDVSEENTAEEVKAENKNE